MNIADKVNTVLDLSGYDALLDSIHVSPWDWAKDAAGLLAIIGALGITIAYGAYLFNTAKINPQLYRNRKMIMVSGGGAALLGVVLLLVVSAMSPKYDIPTFSEYVNEAYGFESSNLPDNKPEDGSLSMVWEKDGEIHSGTLNLLDNKVSIKETGGDYLKVTEQAAQKNGE